MASLNKVLIIGNLGADPELAYTQGGQPVAHFNVATNEVWVDRDGTRQERTEWHRVTVWGKQATSCKEYLRKGRTVFVEGRLRTRQWEDRQGQKRFTTEIIAQNVQFIGATGPGRTQAEDSGANGSSFVETPATDASEPPAIEDDQVPF